MLRAFTLLLTCAALVVASACGGGGNVADRTGGPAIGAIEPASGGTVGGTPLIIRGEGLSNSEPGTYQVLIGGQPATSVSVVSSTEVRCDTPPNAAGPADVVIVANAGEGTVPGGFTYYPPPTVATIDPAIGSKDGGLLVTVTGSGFVNNEPGDTLCLIGGKALIDLEILNDTELTGITPASWTEVAKEVTVVNRNGQATLRPGFRYLGPLPTVSSISPDLGPTSGGTVCTITGEWFTTGGGDLIVRFGTQEVPGVRVDDGTDTLLTCVSPATPLGGPVEVTVRNNNGESSPPISFTYIPVPVITTVTPNSGFITGGDAITILGGAFQAPGAGTTTVTIGGAPVLGMSIVNDSTITCTTPAGSAVGPVDVRIVNDNGSSTLSGGFTYTSPAYWDPIFGTALNGSFQGSFGLSDDDGAYNQSISFSFPFFGVNYTSVQICTNGDLQFTSSPYTTNYSGTLQSFPQIMFMAEDLRPGNNGSVVYAKQVPDRLIVTFNSVPWYSTTGSITCQIHLINDGTIVILYQTVDWGGSTFNNGRVAVNPGSGTPVGDTQSLSNGYIGGTSTQAITYLYNSSTWDMSDSHLIWAPNAGGGYDCLYFPFIP